MSAVVRPLIAIKAGRCNLDSTNSKRIVPSPDPGILYLYRNLEDDILHFCWKPRGSTEPPVDDLLMFPDDATFLPYPSKSGRVFILKFSSSSQRHFYWLQSKSQKADDPGFLSTRDKEWGRRINKLLQGEQGEDDDDGDEDMIGDDEDETMEDVERRDDGAEAREGGADGGRASTAIPSQPYSPSPASADTTTVPQNLPGTTSQADFLRSLIASINVPSGTAGTAPQRKGVPLLLTDLLTPEHTVPTLTSLTSSQLQNLKSLLPQNLFPPNSTLDQDKEIIRRILHSPQFTQGVASLTTALRDEGGCRGVCEGLGVDLNIVAGAARANGGDLVGGYVEGVRAQAEKEGERKEEQRDDKMEE